MSAYIVTIRETFEYTCTIQASSVADAEIEANSVRAQSKESKPSWFDHMVAREVTIHRVPDEATAKARA